MSSHGDMKFVYRSANLAKERHGLERILNIPVKGEMFACSLPVFANVDPCFLEKTYRLAVEHHMNHMIRHPAAVKHLAQQHFQVPVIP